MTDEEMLQAIRCCTSDPDCDRCKLECIFYKSPDPNDCIPEMGKAVADHMEALIAKNLELQEKVAILLENGCTMSREIQKKIFEKSKLEREIGRLEAERDHFRDLTKKPWCGKQYGEDTNAPTIADHIRSMSDFELMEFLWRLNTSDFESEIPFCKSTPECDELLDSREITDEVCKQCLLQKLMQPYDSASL